MKINPRAIAFIGLLIAIEIILQVIGNYVALGPVNLNLSLIPIVIGAIIYGPITGAFLGIVNGAMVLFAPSTLSIFMPLSVGGTILTCLAKGLLCGLLSGFIYKLFKEKHKVVGNIVVALLAPIINSAAFAGFCWIFFQDYLKNAGSSFPSAAAFLFLGIIGWNFIFELLATAILTPSTIKIINIIQRKNHTNI